MDRGEIGGAAAPLPPAEHLNVPRRFATLGWSAWREAFRDLLAARDACFRLARREVVSRYRQSLLGIGWAIITPLATVGVFLFLEGRDLISVEGTRHPYAVFLYLGLLPWQLHAACLTRATASLAASPHLVGRMRFPREALVLAATGSAVFDYLVGAIAAAAVLAWHGIAPAWTAVFLPALLAAQLAFSLALGLALAVLHAALRDLGSMVPLAVLLWMFLTPVLYPGRSGRPATGLPAESWLDWVNPMAAFITAHRDLVLEGGLTRPGPLLLACGLSLVLLPLAWRFFHLLAPRVAESI